MKRLDRYILFKFIGTFFFAVSMLMVIIIVFDLSENIDSFLKHDAPWQRVAVDHYLTSIPYFTNQFIHLFAFISVIFFTSKMANHSEVVAVLSSGVSFWRFLYPYLVGAFLLTMMSLYLGNFLVPNMNEIRRKFKDEYIEHLTKSSGRNVHLQTDKDEFVYVEYYNVNQDLGYCFSVERYKNNELVYKLASDVIYHDSIEPHKWRIDFMTERTIDGDRESIVNYRRLDTIIEKLSATDFYKMKEDFEEMNFFELRDHIRTMRQRGTEGIRNYEVEMHQPKNQRRHGNALGLRYRYCLFICVARTDRKGLWREWRDGSRPCCLDPQCHLHGVGHHLFSSSTKIKIEFRIRKVEFRIFIIFAD